MLFFFFCPTRVELYANFIELLIKKETKKTVMYNEQLWEVYEPQTGVKTTFRTKQSLIQKVKGDANKSLSVSVQHHSQSTTSSL